MSRLRPRLSYANVMVTLLAFVVLGGGAYAATQLPKNSVGTKQLKNNAVTTAKIKDHAITGAKIQNGVLTGAQINASTLGTVPDAAHAINANSAANAAHAINADSAANADTLDGQGASAFAPAGEVHTPPRFILNDPAPGDEEFKTEDFLTLGPFTILGTCVRNFEGYPEEIGTLDVVGPEGSSFAGARYEGSPPEPLVFSLPNTSMGEAAVRSSPGNAIGSGELIAVAPSGQVLKVFASVEVNDPAGDCVFGVTAIGP